jgi:S1-C subfamily serine protease
MRCTSPPLTHTESTIASVVNRNHAGGLKARLVMKRALPLILVLVFAARTPAQGSNSAKQVAGVEAAPRTASSSPITTLAPSQIFSRARPSVVVIVAMDQNGQREALGSGFIVSHGRIATNHHVVEGMNEAYVVFSDGGVKPVSKVVADSTQQDLIVLTVETGSRAPLVFGDELSLQQGDSVYALGAPKGLELTFTNGIVSSFRKSNAQFLIQTTAPIAPGSSGGPLFDRTGRVVGLTTSSLADAPGIYFSVGIGDVKRLLRTAGGVALPFAEWAKQQTGAQNSDVPVETAPSDSQQGPDKDFYLRGVVSVMRELAKAHGTSLSNGKIHRNFFESDAILEPSHPCGAGITHRFPDATAEREVQLLFVVLNLANVDPANIQVDTFNAVKLEMSLFLEGSSPVSEGEYPDPFKNMKKRSGSTDVVFDSRENAEEFARLLRLAVSACRERREQGESF